jgi:hypothetical protein
MIIPGTDIVSVTIHVTRDFRLDIPVECEVRVYLSKRPQVPDDCDDAEVIKSTVTEYVSKMNEKGQYTGHCMFCEGENIALTDEEEEEEEAKDLALDEARDAQPTYYDRKGT